MSNNFWDMTGVLVLNKVTPVIKALFGAFELDPTYPGDGRAYIANMAESTNATWAAVLENLQELADELDLTLDTEDDQNMAETASKTLTALATYFKVGQPETLVANLGLTKPSDFEQDVDLATLFAIAKAFDDGHGLTAYAPEGCWHCDRPRLYEFGGSGEYRSSNVYVYANSTHCLELGKELDESLSSGDTDGAARTIREEVARLLTGIADESVRAKVQHKLAELVAA